MAWSIDARIPLTVLPDAEALAGALAAARPAAVLAEGEPPAGTAALVIDSFLPTVNHAVGCACCAGRSGAAIALDRLFQSRVRGRSGWFERVLVVGASPAGRAEVEYALAHDPLTASRFRVAPG
ncbi:hypothetical protein GXW78_19375 [Roseomonas terrae]|jgi:hypothetical protein|uniref:Uncharacterized protein n=1 Tax=Neoroseomonas terrae TaxID=424799 RepID=A0ABS5ELC6_9PROT|nr:hypothetical protein [Neoroseomonas terrae]MBR0651840.1 hypothetical protein [Neoroseomonas terrae]